jgi:polygalacturonase
MNTPNWVIRRLFLHALLAVGALSSPLSQGTEAAESTPRHEFNVRDFGSVADGRTLNTAAIQRTIDESAAAGGGEVLVPAGVFVTGSLRLKSNITLRLMPGAVLQGSSDPMDYPDHDISAYQKFGTITHDGVFVKAMKSLIIADGAENVSIVGEGTIKGAGDAEAFQLGLNKDGKPKNLFFIGCKNIRLSGIRVQNSAQVTISISGCDRVFVDGIHIRSLVNWNCDGMDVDARDVTIANCLIESEDDALCFKSEYLGRFCENITVSNCVVASICNGIKLGTGSRTGFRNVTVNNCIIRKTDVNAFFHPGYEKMTPGIVLDETTTSVNSGIVILGVDGGLVENIRFSNIIMTDVLSPIFIRVGRRFLNPEGRPSVMRNVSIEHVTAHCRSVIPSIIAGLNDSPVRDIRLADFRVTVPIGVTAARLKEFPESPEEDEKGYPENRLSFGFRLPASAFYIRHAEQVSLRNITLTCVPEEARPAIQTDDVRGLQIGNFRLNDHPLENGTSAIRHLNTEAYTGDTGEVLEAGNLEVKQP